MPKDESPTAAEGFAASAPASVSFDKLYHAAIARMTGGVSPVAVNQAVADWAQHLLLSPDKQFQLAKQAGQQWLELSSYCLKASVGESCAPCVEPLPQDRRFRDAAWQRWPFNALHQSFLSIERWWQSATTDIAGVSGHHENVASFIARQMLDVVAPSNFPLTNPLILEQTLQQGGNNFARGALNAWEDWRRMTAGERPVGAEAFVVGRNVAVTPGKVVYRNRLIELIQYAPATAEVHPEPVLIVPAWIMKYYILDLSPENSLVRYLVEQGFTVFAISWKNPTENDRDLGLEDYRRLGIMDALDAVSAILPDRKVHAAGYCLGGTLLSIAGAAMARDGDARLKSMALFAAQADFTEAGELMLFIDDDQIQFLEDMMAERGYLDSREMAGTFQLLRSNDLIWSAMVHEYLMGERASLNDLMAWNSDATRMPYRMHSEYLRRLFLDNDLAEARFEAGGKPVSLRDIHVPIFAVSAVTDHVAPWRSVYKIQMLTDAEVTFVLSNGGHNVGIVNPPGNPNRYHQISTHKEDQIYIDPDAWQRTAERHDGSWWPRWRDWLARRSGKPVAPPAMGAAAKGYAAICDAPGTYVREP